MSKQNIAKSLFKTIAVICAFLFAGCDSKTKLSSSNYNEKETSSISHEENDFSSSSFEQQEQSMSSSEVLTSKIAKINGKADEVGIYSIVVKLTDQAADKGVIEVVYYGTKGSPQENSIVNRFRIEYYKDSNGTFEISTFYNGDVYQNYHKKVEVTVTNTFDELLRAGSVIIIYTPDGGEPQEIFKADDKYFFGS